jgi:hydroxylaminobenzene mutase
VANAPGISRNRVALSDRWLIIIYWLSLYGTFANWLGISIAAIFNAGRHLTIAANGQEGAPLVEGIVNFSLFTLTLSMLIICVTVIIGLNRNMKNKKMEKIVNSTNRNYRLLKGEKTKTLPPIIILYK